MIQHTILKAKNYAYIEIRRSPQLAEFISAARLFIMDPGYSADLNRLCDFLPGQSQRTLLTRTSCAS